MANQKDLEQYTVAELREMAEEQDLQIPSHATKDEIIKALEKKSKADAKAAGAQVNEQAEVTPLALTGPVNPLPLTGIVADVYGIGRKYNIALADIQVAGAVLQGNLLLDNLPPGSIVQLVRVKHSQSVAGPSITACTAQVGDGTNLYGSTLDIFQAVSNTALQTAQLTANNIGPFAAVMPIYLTLIATGGNLGVATAGALSVWLRYTPVA